MDLSDVRKLRAVRASVPAGQGSAALIAKLDELIEANSIEQREYYHVLPAITVAGGITSSPQNVTPNDDVLIMARSYFAHVGQAVQTDSTRVVPLATVSITGKNGTAIMDNAAPLPCLFGTGDRPYVLPVPQFIRSKTTWSFTVANLTVATTYVIYLVLHGVQLIARG